MFKVFNFKTKSSALVLTIFKLQQVFYRFRN